MLTTLAQAAPTPEATAWLSYLGPFVPFGGLAMFYIWRQGRENARLAARNDELTDRISALHERSAPLIAESTSVLREVAPVISDATVALRDVVRELERRER